jgi:hypothetical protein
MVRTAPTADASLYALLCAAMERGKRKIRTSAKRIITKVSYV